MANGFSKEERVAFEDLIGGFDDKLVISRQVDKYTPMGAMEMERTSDRVWRPQPYNPAVYNGFDQSANFGDITQLSVPVTVSNVKSSNGKMSPTDLRDPSQLRNYFNGAKNTLASAVNTSVQQTAFNWATIVSKRTTPATGFADLADMGARMTRIGVPYDDRNAFLYTSDYLNMADSLGRPQTSDSPLARTAYERAYIRSIGNFDVFELDQPSRLTAATATGVTITNVQPLYYTPVATTVDADGNTTNVDNRTQTISIAVTGSTVKVGDRFQFTTGNVNEVHKVSKADTGFAKTFTIVQIVTGAGGTGTVKISPPIISATGGTKAELEYKNVSTAPTNGTGITFLNTTSANASLYFQKDAIVLVPGTFVVDDADGWAVMRATTANGVNITYTRQGNINDLGIKFRFDVRYGTAALDPERIGIQLFGQS